MATIFGDNTDEVFPGLGEDLSGNDYISARGGDDLIYSLNGNDTVYGGSGDDTVYGGSGADRIYGGSGNDDLFGDSGNDYLSPDSGYDAVDGGSGIDTVTYYLGSSSILYIDLEAGYAFGGGHLDSLSNIENVSARGYADYTLSGDDGANLLEAGYGDDLLRGRGGADTLSGGGGVDTASYTDSGSAVFVLLDTGVGYGGDAAGDRYLSIENVDGSGYGDWLVGDNGANHLRGLSGDDYLYGGSGNDTLEGGYGNDVLRGDGGTDVFVFDVNVNFGDNVIEDFEDGVDRIELRDPSASGFYYFNTDGDDLIIRYWGSTGEIVVEGAAGDISSADIDYVT